MESIQDYDLLMSAEAQVPEDLFEDLTSSLVKHRVRFAVETRPKTYFAGVEWALPTLIVLFVSRKLIDSFMGELGKDLYAAVKGGITRLVSRTTGPAAQVRVSYVVSSATPAKKPGSPPTALSVWALLRDGRRARFTFTMDLEEKLHEHAVAALLEALAQHYGNAEHDSLTMMVEAGAPVIASVLPLVFDRETRRWRPITDVEFRGEK